MHIPSVHVFKAISASGVTELHHANSIATACQFIRSRSLMSRGTVERLGIAQTAQASDEADKSYSVWFDVFLDSVDIHNRANCANVYGPVLFVFDINIINANETGRIWVTKCNPTKWDKKNEEERWFQDKNDLTKNFVLGRFDQMIVLRHCGGSLPFGKHLKKIILDDPVMDTTEQVDIYSMAVGALRLAMQDADINVPIERRKCRPKCSCKNEWGSDDSRLFKMFDPKIK
jgi:hypothetical protein